MALYAFAGGVTEVPGWGQRDRIRFLGTWDAGDRWRIDFTTNTQGDFTLGYGDLLNGRANAEDVSGLATFNYGLVYADRMYLANGEFWSFSGLLDPTGFNQQNVGSGFQAFSTSYGVSDEAVSMAITQGRLAVFGRQNIQIWSVDADPAAFARVQILQNAGTIAPDSVQSVGELDVLYLDDTGVRSLRTKETTLNAFVDDVGTPIDKTLQAVISGLTDDEKAQIKSIVDPQSKRYWIYIDGTIYVLSRFPNSKISAWSTYAPTTKILNAGNQVEFLPIRFFIHQGKVYVWAMVVGVGATFLLVYGGTTGVVYDECVPTVDLPWIEMGQPATVKQACGLQAAFKGKWAISASMSPTNGAMTEIVNRGSTTAPDSLLDSTYDIGHFNYQANGTHMHLKAVGAAAAEAQVLSMLTVEYNDANKK